MVEKVHATIFTAEYDHSSVVCFLRTGIFYAKNHRVVSLAYNFASLTNMNLVMYVLTITGVVNNLWSMISKSTSRQTGSWKKPHFNWMVWIEFKIFLKYRIFPWFYLRLIMFLSHFKSGFGIETIFLFLFYSLLYWKSGFFSLLLKNGPFWIE